MKRSKSKNMRAMLIILIVTVITRMIPFFAWWSFTIPVIIAGMIISNIKWSISFFWTGFISGFILWFGTNLYFDLRYPGDLLTNVGQLLSIPKIVVFIISGLIGGVLTGLAFYTGKTVLFRDEISSQKNNIA